MYVIQLWLTTLNPFLLFISSEHTVSKKSIEYILNTLILYFRNTNLPGNDIPGHRHLRLLSKCGASRDVKLRRKSKELDQDMICYGQRTRSEYGMIWSRVIWSLSIAYVECEQTSAVLFLLNFLLELSFENNADSSLEH